VTALAGGSPNQEPVLRVVSGYPDPDEVAALVAVLTAVARAGTEASASGRAEVRPGQAPAGAFAHRYQSPISWQTP
jgi:hypothetical protein